MALDYSLIHDFKEFAPSFLKIKTKTGGLAPFAMNRAQLYAHQKIEEQKAKQGYVRAIVLKGRQQGMSTYVGGRLFHLTATNFGMRTFILTHEQAATDNLFTITQRYYEHYPAQLKPSLGAANAKELVFDKLDSSFSVATAGNRGAGRSSTAQLFHGSEVAYWPSAKTHMSGIMQAIPLATGTEIILESTANGVGGSFHEIWQQAEQEQGGWVAIFVPWHWQDEYVTDGVQLTPEDRDYGRMHNLSEHQLMWRRHKIGELGGDIKLFQREYPSSPAEAFSVAGDDSLIHFEFVQRARKADIETDHSAPIILGVDPARFGDDSTVIYVRQGRVAERAAKVHGKDTMQVVGEVIRCYNLYSPDAVFIDVGGLGAGVVDRLRELGYSKCRGINFGEKPLDKGKYINKRAEMWGTLRDWLSSPPVEIPDDDSLESDLCALKYTYDSLGRLQIESKAIAKSRGIKSPDDGDALALTFAMPVVKESVSSSIYEDGVFETSYQTVAGMGR